MTTEEVLRAEEKSEKTGSERFETPAVLTSGTLFSCLLRTYLVGAGFNTRGMQNIGFAFAMEPGLAAIYGACPEALQDARRRYVRHYNTHPFWTPYMAGLFLNVERKVALGLFPGKFMENMRSTTMYTLSAIGDSFFSGSVLVFWSLVAACLIISGHGGWAIGLGAFAFVSLQMFKAVTFFYGFQEGLSFLQRLKGWNLINWGRRLKMVNGGLMVLLWILAWPEATIMWYDWLLSALIMAVSAWLVSTVHLSREILAVIAFGTYLSYPILKSLTAGIL
jgi:PTS system mannose-specific IID component